MHARILDGFLWFQTFISQNKIQTFAYEYNKEILDTYKAYKLTKTNFCFVVPVSPLNSKCVPLPDIPEVARSVALSMLQHSFVATMIVNEISTISP